MSLFARSTPFDADIEKATSEMNTTEDWGLIMDICDKMARAPNGCKDGLRSIIKRINHRVPYVSMQALTMLDASVNNCGRPFHLEVCSRDFISECRTLIGQKAHPKVAQRLKLIIKKWAEMSEFKDDPTLSLIPTFYDSLKKEGMDFSDPDTIVKSTPVAVSTDPNVVQTQQEEDDIAKAIALSLQETDKNSQTKTSGLYPASFSSTLPTSSNRPKEVRKVRALYDFEAAEDNELTFKAGELISVLDDSDANWWKGFNHRGEGLFPANFATADLSVEPEELKPEKKVQFSEDVQVKTLETPPEEVEIDEGKIDQVLQMIQNADPTGETQADDPEMIRLEEHCKAMGPLIDAELEKTDSKHTGLIQLNSKVMDALQMYHNLMKEMPVPYGYKGAASLPYMPGGMPMQQPPPSQSMYNGQPQYIPQSMSQVPGQMPQVGGQVPPGGMPPAQGAVLPQQSQNYSAVPAASSQTYNSMPAPSAEALATYASLPGLSSVPSQNAVVHTSQNGAVPVSLQTSYPMGPPVASQPQMYNQPLMYQPQAQQQPLL